MRLLCEPSDPEIKFSFSGAHEQNYATTIEDGVSLIDLRDVSFAYGKAERNILGLPILFSSLCVISQLMPR